MIGAKSQLKWFWRSVVPAVVLLITLKVESASATFVTDPQTTPKPCVRLQRKAVWKRARKIAIMVYGSNCLFGSRFPRRAQPSHAGDALESVRLLGSHPCRGADGNLRTIGGGGKRSGRQSRRNARSVSCLPSSCPARPPRTVGGQDDRLWSAAQWPRIVWRTGPVYAPARASSRGARTA